MSAINQPGYKGEIDDEAVEQFVSQHPEGASYEQIGEATGLTRQRVQQLCARALVKALKKSQAMGMMCPEFGEAPESTWQKMENS